MQLVSKLSNPCGPDPPTLQTDGQTDRQTDGRHEMARPRFVLSL